MISSLRSVMTLLLLAGLAACDRQSPPAGQANASASGKVTGDEVQPAAGDSAKGEFNYTIDRSKAGTPAPTFAFENPQGGTATLQDFAGRPLLVNLWATWCAPCLKEMPALDALQGALGGPDFAVVAVNIDTRNLDKPKAWLADNRIEKLAYYADPQAKVFQELRAARKVEGMPVSLIVDREGCELAILQGPADWASADAKALIGVALKRP